MDKLSGVAAALSAVNHAVLVGFGDSLFSGNATITLVIAAVLAAAPGAGFSVDDLNRIARGLRLGVNAGAFSETHSLTTIAGARSACTALDPTLPSTFTGGAAQ